MNQFEEAVIKLAGIKLELLAKQAAGPKGSMAPAAGLTGAVKAPVAPKAAPPISSPTIAGAPPALKNVGLNVMNQGPTVPAGKGR